MTEFEKYMQELPRLPRLPWWLGQSWPTTRCRPCTQHTGQLTNWPNDASAINRDSPPITLESAASRVVCQLSTALQHVLLMRVNPLKMLNQPDGPLTSAGSKQIEPSIASELLFGNQAWPWNIGYECSFSMGKIKDQRRSFHGRLVFFSSTLGDLQSLLGDWEVWWWRDILCRFPSFLPAKTSKMRFCMCVETTSIYVNTYKLAIDDI